jgi:ankyrin repeat protein
VDTKLKAKLISQLNLHEYESGRYPTSVCLFGPSGCGRTSFLRSFTLGLEGYKDVIIVAFEKQDFQASDPSIVDILKSFSHQILCHVPSAFSRISRYYQFLGNQDVWTEQLLWSFVLKLLRGARRHKLILLIDDIGDWLSPFRELLQTLEMLSQSSSFGLQVICTATVDQPSLIPGQTLSINMAEEGTWQDVSEILKTRLIDNKIASESIENDIDRELQANPGNCLTTYLYLKQISRLSTLTTPSILGRELPKLPHGREDIYKAEIEMLVSKDQDILQWSWSSLSWLVQAIHPLTIPELSVAVALHQTGSDMSKSDIRNHIPANMWDYLDRHLGLLVYRDGQRLVKVHDTAKEFIRCHSNTTAGKGCRLASHAEITILCLRYLETVMATCNNSTVEEHSEYGFMRYTVEYWPRHYHLATEDGRVNETGLDQHVLEFLSRHETCIPWFKRYQTTASRLISVDPTEADGFEVACGLGQASIVSRMLGEKTPDGVDDKLLQRSLNTALKNNQSAVVPILLHAGARSELALCFAAERNIVSAVDQLLEHDKGLEETSSLEKAITSAATYGCLQAIVRLCDHCTNPNELVRIKRSALDRAVTGGHASIVSFLLLKPRGSTDSPTSRDLPTARRSEGVDFALRDLTTQYKSALDIAAASGHADIIFLLLEAGAKATNSALEIASKQQSIETVRLLAQALMSQNCITNSPMALHFASEKGYLRIVTELLNHGMDTNCRDDCNQTPLHKAAKRGHKDIVRLLLQRGANRTACDDQEVLPCHLAAQGGHIETLKALHEDPEASHDDFLVVCAAKGGHFLMVRYLLSLKSMTLNKGDQNTLNSALLEATSRGYLSVVRESQQSIRNGFSTPPRRLGRICRNRFLPNHQRSQSLAL